METVTSSDGTRIAFEVTGAGPPLVLVHGTTADRSRWARVLPKLARRFTVFAMDRRGRGGSGDAPDWALEREYEDVVAVMEAAGDSVDLLGHSFGALCALEAALRTDRLRRLVLYEPGFPVGDAPLYPADLAGLLTALIATGAREEALEEFFRLGAGMRDDELALLRADPYWKTRVAAVHTAVREMADGDYRLDADRLRQLNVPVLLLLGEVSPEPLRAPTLALAATLPDARVVELPGQAHIAMSTAPDLFLRAVLGFLAA